MRVIRYLPRFRRAYRELETLAQREQWSRGDIEAFQLDRLNTVWRHAVTHVPYYRDLNAANNLPEQFSSVADFKATVPVLRKETVQRNPDAFLSTQAERGMWWRTGGSTGTPMRVYWSHAAHREVMRAKYRHLQMWDCDILDRSAVLWGHSASFAPGLAGRIDALQTQMEDRLRGRLRLSAYELGRDDLQKYLAQIAAFRPRMLYGYGSALHLLAREAEGCGFRCDAIRMVTLTGEPAFPYMVDSIERAFGAPATIEYGSHECGLTAVEWSDRTLRVREDLVLGESLLREDGRHDIVLTVLSNPSFPILRYAIEDVTDAPLSFPDRGFAVLSNVAGRNNDLVVTRSGRCLHSATFDALFKYGQAGIRRFRVRQHADGSLAALVEATDTAVAIDTTRLASRLTELLEGFPARVTVVDELPQTAAGKHRMVLSDLAHAGNGNGGAGHTKPNGTRGSTPAHEGPQRVAEVSADPVKQRSDTGSTKAAVLRNLVVRPEIAFLMEAHNGLSAKIAEEAGFEALWASGLSISAALGVRDSNEASWTQVLEVLEFMSDGTTIPILVDGDTGYGNFNNMRRLVRKLEQRGIAGVCIEDKLFPKTNSFLRGTTQPLADVGEFCGRIQAGKEAQTSDDFVIVARVEAFIAGWGLAEAIRRAEAYRVAGADAILMHSAQRSPQEVLAFQREWGDRLPVVIVPTKYYATPTDVFREFGFSCVIWANHLMRSCITTMQRTAQQIYEDESLINVEDRVAPLAEVFRIQGAPELAAAEKRYLPNSTKKARAVVLATAAGRELGELTAHKPKCMVDIAGQPLLSRIVETYRSAGIRDIAVVRGYKKESVTIAGVTYHDNDEPECTGEACALAKARPAIEGPCIISYGDVLFKKFIPQQLTELDADFGVMVDANWRESRNRERHADYVTCSHPNSRTAVCERIMLEDVSDRCDDEVTHGEWMGFLWLSAAGAMFLREVLAEIDGDPERRQTMDLAGLLRTVLRAGKEIRVIYTTGNWLDVDSVEDVLVGSSFQ